MPNAVRNWLNGVPRPKEDPLVEAFHEILKSKAVWQAHVPLMQGLLIAEDKSSTFHCDRNSVTARRAKEVQASSQSKQRGCRNQAAHRPQMSDIFVVCQMVQIRARRGVVLEVQIVLQGSNKRCPLLHVLFLLIDNTSEN